MKASEDVQEVCRAFLAVKMRDRPGVTGSNELDGEGDLLDAIDAIAAGGDSLCLCRSRHIRLVAGRESSVAILDVVDRCWELGPDGFPTWRYAHHAELPVPTPADVGKDVRVNAEGRFELA